MATRRGRPQGSKSRRRTGGERYHVNQDARKRPGVTRSASRIPVGSPHKAQVPEWAKGLQRWQRQRSTGTLPKGNAPVKTLTMTANWGKFLNEIKDFHINCEASLVEAYKESIRDVVNDAQLPARGLDANATGRMPFETGFLRQSLVVSLGGGVPAQTGRNRTRESKLAAVAAGNGFGNVEAIDHIVAGSFVRITWTAFYAMHLEFGSKNNQAYYFARGAIEKWPQFVRDNAQYYRDNPISQGG